MTDGPEHPEDSSSPRPHGARKKSFQTILADRESSVDRTPVRHGYVKSFDGVRLFYSTEGQGQPLVFCYGLVCSSLHWTYQIEHFRRTHQAIWFDYRGHQNSDTPKDFSSLTLENTARDLATVLDELKIHDAIFLGHSMGVNVVLEFLRQHPTRVKGMVLANGTAQRPLETLFRSNAMEKVFKVAKQVYDAQPALVRKLWRLQSSNPLMQVLITLGGFNPHLTPKEDIDLYYGQVMKMDPGILLHLIQSYDHFDATPWLHTVKVPTLVIAGEEDRLVPIEQQELLHQLIPGSELEVILHGSHCPQMDLPELVTMKIEQFINKIRAGSSPTKENASQSSATDPDLDPLRLA